MVINQMLKNQKSFGETWSELLDHNRDAKQLKDLQREVNVTKQEKVDITKENLKKILGRMPNWKSPDLDLVPGFWSLVKEFQQFAWESKITT